MLLSHSFPVLCFFLNLIREARQKGSGSGEGQSTLSIRDSCSSSLSDKALHCTATLHTRTVQYHNTEIRHYLYFPNQHHHQPKSPFYARVGVPFHTIMDNSNFSVMKIYNRKLKIINLFANISFLFLMLSWTLISESSQMWGHSF